MSVGKGLTDLNFSVEAEEVGLQAIDSDNPTCRLQEELRESHQQVQTFAKASLKKAERLEWMYKGCRGEPRNFVKPVYLMIQLRLLLDTRLQRVRSVDETNEVSCLILRNSSDIRRTKVRRL